MTVQGTGARVILQGTGARGVCTVFSNVMYEEDTTILGGSGSFHHCNTYFTVCLPKPGRL